METENFSNVENSGEVVATPETEITTEITDTANIENVANSPVVEETKPAQSQEENAAFAKVRREAEAKAEARARDAVIAEQYGESHGIYTYADYKAAMAEAERQQKYQDAGITEEQAKSLFEMYKQQDPDFQELNNIRTENNTKAALNDLNTQLSEYGIDLQIKDLSTEELVKLPNIEAIADYTNKGYSLSDAYFLANKSDIIANKTKKIEQETISKISGNDSTPGSLSGSGKDKIGIGNMSSDDFKKLTEDVLMGRRKSL